MAGVQTQSWETRTNSNESALWVAFNSIYPYYSNQDWLNSGKYMMLFLTGLLNF